MVQEFILCKASAVELCLFMLLVISNNVLQMDFVSVAFESLVWKSKRNKT